MKYSKSSQKLTFRYSFNTTKGAQALITLKMYCYCKY